MAGIVIPPEGCRHQAEAPGTGTVRGAMRSPGAREPAIISP